MELVKSDLKYKYSWTVYGNDNPKVVGNPDKTLFNRNEGYEVLYLINKMCDLYNIKYKSTALQIEKIINTDLPGNIRSQQEVIRFIVDNI